MISPEAKKLFLVFADLGGGKLPLLNILRHTLAEFLPCCLPQTKLWLCFPPTNYAQCLLFSEPVICKIDFSPSVIDICKIIHSFLSTGSMRLHKNYDLFKMYVLWCYCTAKIALTVKLYVNGASVHHPLVTIDLLMWHQNSICNPISRFLIT